MTDRLIVGTGAVTGEVPRPGADVGPGGAGRSEAAAGSAPVAAVGDVAAARPELPGGVSVAVLVPCYNEEVTVGSVVRAFREALPAATVYVYDNNSSDGTVGEATSAGAVVRREALQGKGNVVRRMFADVEADVYVLVDGDDTYEAAAAPALVGLVLDEGFDLVNGSRISQGEESFRRGHAFGNRLLGTLVSRVFGRPSGDLLSGYKVLSRRFVKSFPVFASGFEIETELTVHAFGLEMPTTEVALPYRERPAGSESKLSTFGDGFRIVRTIGRLLRSERPMAFFSLIALVLAVVAVVLAIPLGLTFAHTHQVPRLPTAVLVTGLMILAFLSLAAGLILDTVTRGRHEAKALRYLAIPGPLEAGGGSVRGTSPTGPGPADPGSGPVG
jgi:hypothetical protein